MGSKNLKISRVKLQGIDVRIFFFSKEFAILLLLTLDSSVFLWCFSSPPLIHLISGQQQSHAWTTGRRSEKKTETNKRKKTSERAKKLDIYIYIYMLDRTTHLGVVVVYCYTL